MPGGWFFERGRTNGCHKARNGWYLGLAGHCRFTDPIWLERAKSLITKR